MADCVAVSLVRYAERIGYRECAFFGVLEPDADKWECRAIWTQSQRQMVADALAQAQGMIEDELRYPLCPRYITDERHVWASPIIAEWGHVIAGGVMSDTIIAAAAAAVNHATDPATVTVAGVTCDPESIRVYHTGTVDEITPSSIVLGGSAGDTMIITIPWCRLVHPTYQDNPETGLDYADHATWIAGSVDVHCVTLDPSTQAHLITAPGICCDATAPCTATEYDGCIFVRQPVIGSVSVARGDYTSGAWVRKTLCKPVSWVELNYLAGLTTLPRQAEDMIIRLAHSLMPDEPCGCDSTQRLWKRDRNVPQVLTRERINCPFGLSDGAYACWMWCQSAKLRRGSVL